MQSVKTTFSIKDLETLGGIKAHTIRIWEKRYHLLQPDRTDTNIRTYSISDLQKLLNVSFLVNHDHKISSVAKLTTEEIAAKVRDLATAKKEKLHTTAINDFKLAMLNFDRSVFDKTYNDAKKEHDFDTVFTKIFIPLLNEIGMLWQTDTINPAHEHFISNLIMQKLLLEIEKCPNPKPEVAHKIHVLYLPLNEIHELGLMYLNYKISKAGYPVVYLGQNIQVESLKYFAEHHPDTRFITYLTIQPENSIADYAQLFNETLNTKKLPLYMLGRKANMEKSTKLPGNAKVFESIEAFAKTLENHE